jgi:hypothetical protein
MVKGAKMRRRILRESRARPEPDWVSEILPTTEVRETENKIWRVAAVLACTSLLFLHGLVGKIQACVSTQVTISDISLVVMPDIGRLQVVEKSV